ncbi:hypothetical protein MNBD_BACTEROID04-1198, partial [hydrothermal vent metagenome]
MKLQHLIFTLVISVIFLSCNNKTSQNTTNNIFKFKKYISYTTSGVVSVAEPIKIGLVNEVDSWIPNKEINKNILNISPKIEGELFVQNSRNILFQPSKHLKPNKEYTVTINLGKIYNNVPYEYKNY